MNHTPQHQTEPDWKRPALFRAVTRPVSVVVGLAMLCLGTVRCAGADASLKEHELKAAFIYNFTKFIEWPSNSFGDASTPFVVAVAGNTPCKTELDQIAKERKVNGRELVIKSVKSPEAVKGAQVLFVSANEEPRLKDWLAGAGNASALTIGESESFLKQGGMINFLLEGEKIRFEINIDQTDSAGLKVSAQLQKLAKAVRRKL